MKPNLSRGSISECVKMTIHELQLNNLKYQIYKIGNSPICSATSFLKLELLRLLIRLLRSLILM